MNRTLSVGPWYSIIAVQLRLRTTVFSTEIHESLIWEACYLVFHSCRAVKRTAVFSTEIHESLIWEACYLNKMSIGSRSNQRYSVTENSRVINFMAHKKYRSRIKLTNH
jgi:hypothetical protein